MLEITGKTNGFAMELSSISQKCQIFSFLERKGERMKRTSELRNRDPENGYKNLGTANGWREVPEIVKACVAKQHSPKKTGVGRCLTEIKCSLCRYIYLIDSSD